MIVATRYIAQTGITIVRATVEKRIVHIHSSIVEDRVVQCRVRHFRGAISPIIHNVLPSDPHGLSALIDFQDTEFRAQDVNVGGICQIITCQDESRVAAIGWIVDAPERVADAGDGAAAREHVGTRVVEFIRTGRANGGLREKEAYDG